MSDYELLEGGTVRVYKTLTPNEYAEIKNQLTDINPQYTMAMRANKDVTNIKKYIVSWRELGGFLHVPRHYNHKAIAYLTRARIKPRGGDFKLNMKSQPRPNQLSIIEKIKGIPGDLGLCLPCGVGKTFLGLHTATQTPGRILIVVTTQVKFNEWRKEIESHTDVLEQGYTVGQVQASARKWEQHPISIAMLKTLAMQDFPVEFFNGFSTVIWDEVHLATSPVLSQALGRVNGRQIMLTATPGEGVRRKLIDLHCGTDWVVEHVAGAKTTAVFVTVPISESIRRKEWDIQKQILSKNQEYTAYAISLTQKALKAGRRVMVLNALVLPLHRIYHACGGGFVMGEESLNKLAKGDVRIHNAVEAVTPSGSMKAKLAAYIDHSKKHANPILGIGLNKTHPAGVGMDVSDLDGGVIMFPVPNEDMTQQLVGRWNRINADKKPPVIAIMVPDSPVAHKLAEKMAAKLQSLDVDVQFAKRE